MSAPRRTAVFVANRAFGMARSRLPLIERLVGADWRVVALSTDHGPTSEIEAAGAEFIPLTFASGGATWSDLQALRRLAAEYRFIQPELIHHFNTKAMTLGAIAALGSSAAVIHTVTGLGLALGGGGGSAFLLRAALRQLLPRADRVIFQNPDDREMFLRWSLVTEDRARVVLSSGVDVDRFSPEARMDATADVLFIGRLIRQKGVLEFCRVAVRLRERHRGVRFRIAGAPEAHHPGAIDPDLLDALAQDGAVELLGLVEDVPTLLKETAIVVAPSLVGEGVPRVLLEAAACGVPVITTDVPGCRSAVIHDRTGILVPPGDEEALAAAVSRLLHSRERRRAMGAEGRRWMVSDFTTEQVVEQTLQVYDEVLDEPVLAGEPS